MVTIFWDWQCYYKDWELTKILIRFPPEPFYLVYINYSCRSLTNCSSSRKLVTGSVIIIIVIIEWHIVVITLACFRLDKDAWSVLHSTDSTHSWQCSRCSGRGQKEEIYLGRNIIFFYVVEWSWWKQKETCPRVSTIIQFPVLWLFMS